MFDNWRKRWGSSLNLRALNPSFMKRRNKREDNFFDSIENPALVRRLQLLHCHTLQARNAEHKEIVTFLNDTAVQTLSALHMQLSLALSQPQAEGPPPPLADSLALVGDLVAEMTRMGRRLWPIELDTLGLNAALQQMGKEFTRLAPPAVHYQGTELPPLPEATALALFRLAQEALANVFKHAQATQVWVRLETDGRTAGLTIKDNGRGFGSGEDITSPLEAPGLGLFGLMICLQQLEGQVTINSILGQGTTVTAVIPLRLN